VISRPWSRDSSSFCPGLGLKTCSPRSRSWSQDSMLGAYACSTITVICSTFKRVLCHQLELMQPVLWSRDQSLETRVHFVQLSVSVSRPEIQGLGLETWRPRSWSWSWDLKTQVLVLVLRPEDPGLSLGLKTWSPRSRSWSRDLKTQVSVLVSRPEVQGLGPGLET